MLYEILRHLALFFLLWLFNIEVKGKEVFPHKQRFILASNHLSNLDPIVLGAVCPHQLCFLAKKELFENRLFALLLKMIGVIPLSRGRVDIKIMRAALNILKKKPLIIFPQGTRGADYSRFKAGVGFLHKRTRLPIIAAKIYGTEKILPKESKFIRKGKIKVFFEKVNDIKSEDTYEEITAKVMEKIKAL